VLNATTNFRIGISDFRGDGRPDFHYHAHVFYGDSVSPTRASVAGGTPLTIQGLGFRAGDLLDIGALSAPLLALSAKQILVAAPDAPDGVQNISLEDPPSGGTSVMTEALTYGAGPNDSIELVAGANQKAPVGGQAPSPVVVQVLAPDGVTPVAGASVFFTSTPAASLAACGGASSCTLLSNQNGVASSYVAVLTPAVITITVQLAPASYNPPQQVQAVVIGTSSALDIALAPQSAWIAQGATVAIPLTARVLSSGVPLIGHTVDFQVLKGSGLLSASSVASDTNGYATSTLQLSSLGGDISVSACVQNPPFDNPCLTFSGTAVPASSFSLLPVAGILQATPLGQSFHPVTVQVTDSATPPHPVLGANVAFESILALTPQNQPIVWIGDTGITGNPMPVILSSSQTTVSSDANGQATLQPSTAGAQGPVVLLGTAAAGSSSLQFELQLLSPVRGSATNAATPKPVSNLRKATAAR
jgi:IPT/TIG domain